MSNNMQLERYSGDNLVAFYDLQLCVKKVWLHSPVATKILFSYLLIFQSRHDQLSQFFHSVP